MDYYTGTVVETILLGNEQYGSICSGGRYDNLAENYTKNKLPGVGISIGLTRLFFILKEIGFIDKYQIEGNESILIIPIGDTLEYCGKLIESLKAEGKCVQIYLENDKLKKKMDYANKLGIDKVIVVGEEEIKYESFSIKDMKTGTAMKYKINN